MFLDLQSTTYLRIVYSTIAEIITSWSVCLCACTAYIAGHFTCLFLQVKNSVMSRLTRLQWLSNFTKPSNVACAPGGSYSPAPTGFSMHYRHAYAAKGSVAARVALNVRINERWQIRPSHLGAAPKNIRPLSIRVILPFLECGGALPFWHLEAVRAKPFLQ